MKLVLDPDGRWLVLDLGVQHATLSWAIVNGGRSRASEIVWRGVGKGDWDSADPTGWFRGELQSRGFPDAVGLLTACDLARYEVETRSEGSLEVQCVTTLGMSNALSAGDPPGPLRSPAGTINTVCIVSRPLSEEAFVEAIALAAEARTAAVLEAQVPSRRSDRLATGTGTDCIVIAAPDAPAEERYAGKHTLLGALLGAAVREATGRALVRGRS